MHVALSSCGSEEKVLLLSRAFLVWEVLQPQAANALSAPQCLWEGALWLGLYPLLPCTQVGSPGTEWDEIPQCPNVSADGHIGTSYHVVKLAGCEHSRALRATSTTRGFPGNCLGMIFFTEAC